MCLELESIILFNTHNRHETLPFCKCPNWDWDMAELLWALQVKFEQQESNSKTTA